MSCDKNIRKDNWWLRHVWWRGVLKRTQEDFGRIPLHVSRKRCVWLSLANTNGWECHTLDVKAAYLQGNEIGRVVHLRPPPEFADDRLRRLKKTVYGLCEL